MRFVRPTLVCLTVDYSRVLLLENAILSWGFNKRLLRYATVVDTKSKYAGAPLLRFNPYYCRLSSWRFVKLMRDLSLFA